MTMDVAQILSAEGLGILGGALALGYFTFRLMLMGLPRKLNKQNEVKREVMLKEARAKAQKLKGIDLTRTQKRIQRQMEEVDSEVEEAIESLELQEQDLEAQEEFVTDEELRLQRKQSDIGRRKQKVGTVQTAFEKVMAELDESRTKLQEALENHCGERAAGIRTYLRDDIINRQQLETQKTLKQLSEDLNVNGKKYGARLLSRLLNRYQPEFVWPKSVNHVELTSGEIFEKAQKEMILEQLREMTDQVEIDFVVSETGDANSVRLVGGYGMDKEAARLTLEDTLNRPGKWNQLAEVYQKHRDAIDQKAIHLGREAVKQLEIRGLHPEVQKMVGALNWRTSYRQNQYLHSVEVSRLAGILAHELGVDPNLAKRAGLLHDIGKGIDYRIEGSHAVISGDYADRYGESKVVCDTVMSHHNDLVLETTLSYVLKSADTLSGARPGARVNLEEGYQIRLGAIHDAVRSFKGIVGTEIMNGGREVHVAVNHTKVKDSELKELASAIAKKIEEDVAYPGQIKVLVSRRFEAVSVA